MILFRCTKRSQSAHHDIDVLIYADHEDDAIRYLVTLPLFWNETFKPGDFKEVVPPKGPSPSVLMYDKGNRISAD